jgi:hypothetical protein
MIVMAFVPITMTKPITIMKMTGGQVAPTSVSGLTNCSRLTNHTGTKTGRGFMIVSGFGTGFGIKSTHDHGKQRG